MSKLPYSWGWIATVRHGGSGLTNESGEAITRPPTTRCGAQREPEFASYCALHGQNTPENRLVQMYFKSSVGDDRPTGVTGWEVGTYVRTSPLPLLFAWVPGAELLGLFLRLAA